jgi:hypothetical protein
MPDPTRPPLPQSGFDLYIALHERGIRPWVRPRRGRHEDAVTALLAQLGEVRIHSSLRRLVLEALAPEPEGAGINRLRSGGLVLADRPDPVKSPDLVTFEEGGTVLQVVEVKFGAAGNVSSLGEYLAFPSARFADPTARSFNPTGNCNLHRVTRDWACAYGCDWHTAKRYGRARAGTSQIDYYRCSNRWIGVTKRGHSIAVADPTQVQWIVLDLDDRHGRPPAEIFHQAYSAPEWVVTGYGTFDPAIVNAYDAALRLCGAGSREAELLSELLSHLAPASA